MTATPTGIGPRFTKSMLALSLATAGFGIRAAEGDLTLSALRVENGGVVLEWNAIPGREYVVRSKSNLDAADWDFRAAVMADSTVATWRDHFNAATPRLFYELTCYQEGTCWCDKMMISHADPRLGRVKFTFRPSRFIENVTVEIPFIIVGTIQCGGIRGSGQCNGELEVSLVGNGESFWKINNADGSPVSRFWAKPDLVSVKGSDPAAPKWNIVHGPCEETAPYSVGANYSETIPGLEPSKRRALSGGSMYLRGDLSLTITARCDRNPPVTRTVRLVVDSRMDASTDADVAKEIIGGFDDEASDYDGDGRNPDNSPFDPTR